MKRRLNTLTLMKHAGLPVLLLAAMTLGSCDTKTLYEETLEIQESGWTYSDTLAYHFSVNDTLQIYDLYLTLWHRREYPFQNVYVNVHTVFPEGQRLVERLSLEMMDADRSLWLGECGNEKCRLDMVLQEGAFFQQPGDYTILLEQHTRIDTLPGIERIALKIEETDQRREAANPVY